MKSKILKTIILSIFLMEAFLANASDLVGTLSGEFSVDNKGAANYSVQISLPPGINGLQPDVSIDYSSSVGNGVMGVGFSFSAGQSQITRGRSILARDLEVRGIEFSDADKLYLDGKRLIIISGTYFKSGSEYRTEVEGFSIIKAFGSPGSTPDYFEVTTKNGNRLYYGNYQGSADAYQKWWDRDEVTSEVYAYALTRIEDLNGNYIKYNYTEIGSTTGEYVLQSINYTGTTLNSPLTEIQFLYNQNVVSGDNQSDVERDDMHFGYVGGMQGNRTQRLDKILVKSDNGMGNDVTVSEYDFTYEYSPVSHLSRLISISPIILGAAGLDILNPTIFDWADYPDFKYGVEPPENLFGGQLSFSTNYSFERSFFFVDVDGDGRDDYVKVVKDFHTSTDIMEIIFIVALSEGNSFGIPSVWSTITEYMPEFYRWGGDGWPPFKFPATIPGDINGDGRTDFVVVHQPGYIDYILSDGNKFGNEDGAENSVSNIVNDNELFEPWHNELHLAPYKKLPHSGRVSVSDFNGDGRDDVLINTYKGNILMAWNEPSSQSARFSQPVVWSTSTSPVGHAVFFDWALWEWKQSTDQVFDVTPFVGDYNGDGVSDYAFLEHKKEYSCGINGWARDSFIFRVILSDTDNSPLFSSFNIIESAYMSLSNPPQDEGDLNDAIVKFMTGDINGDEITDVLVLLYGKWSLYTFTGGTNGIPKWKHTLDPFNSDVWTNNFLPFNQCMTLDYYADPYGGLGNVGWCFPVQTNFEAENYSQWVSPTVGLNYLVDINKDGKDDFLWAVGNASCNDPNNDEIWTYASAVEKGWWVCYSKGNGFELPTKYLDRSEGGLLSNSGDAPESGSYQPVEMKKLEFPDINGDGNSECVLTDLTWGNYGPTGFSFNSRIKGDLVTCITNGLGSKLEIDYKSITDSSVYTKGVSVKYPIKEAIVPQYVVANVYRDTGGNYTVSRDSSTNLITSSQDAYRISYQYSGNRFDASGRGSLGFHSFVTIDHATKLIKYQFLAQSFPMTGLTKREQTYRAANLIVDAEGNITSVDLQPISSQDNDVVFDEVKESPSGPLTGSVFPFMSHSIELRWEFDSSTPLQLDADDPESLFYEYNSGYSTNKDLAHSHIESYVWFDEMSTASNPANELGSIDAAFDNGTGTGPSHVAGSQDGSPVGFYESDYADWNAALAAFYLPGEITYGNITRTRVDYSDGYATDSWIKFLPSASAPQSRTDLIDWTQVVATTPTIAIQGSPVTRFTYNSQAQVATETTDTGALKTSGLAQEDVYNTDSRLSSTKHFTYDASVGGLLKKVEISDNTDDAYYDLISGIGTKYTSMEVMSWDPTKRFPERKQNTYGHWTEREYDAFGRIKRFTDINNEDTTTKYDGLGRVIEVTDNLRKLTTTTTIGETASGTGVTGIQTVSLRENPPGGPNGIITAELEDVLDDQQSKYYIRTVTDGLPPVTVHYDRIGREIRSIKEGYDGQETFADTIYDLEGQIVAYPLAYEGSVGPIFWTWTFKAYDELGRVAYVESNLGNGTATIYDGRSTTVTVDAWDVGVGVNPPPQTTTTLVNVKGETIKVWNADNTTTPDEKGENMGDPSIEFELDGFGRMLTTKTWQGGSSYLETLTTYDALGSQTSLDDPDKGHWSYTSDPLKRLRHQEDENGSTVVNSYDRLNRVTTRISTGGGTSIGYSETANWWYYDDTVESTSNTIVDTEEGWIGAVQRESLIVSGNSWAEANHTTETAYYYDTKGNPYLDLHNIDGKWYYRSTEYDGFNRPARANFFWRPKGYETDYSTLPHAWQSFGVINTYDDEGYITLVADNQGREWWRADATKSPKAYDHMDRPVLYQKGNSFWTSHAFHAHSGLLLRTYTGNWNGGGANWDVQANHFFWDGLGNLVKREDVRWSANKEKFTYDNLNRLTQAEIENANHVLDYSYYINGNILSKDDADNNSSSFSYGDSNHPHAVTSAFGHTIAYDANGNMSSRSATGENWAFKWASFDKPLWLGRTKDGYTRGSAFRYGINRQRVVHFEFDSLLSGKPDHLTHKKIYVTSGMEVDYKMNGSVWDLDTVRIYIPAPGGNAGAVELDPNATTSSQHDLHVYHYDNLGSIQAVTDYGETSTNWTTLFFNDFSGKELLYSYDPFGSRRDPADWKNSAKSQNTYTWAWDNPSTTGTNEDDPLTRGYTGHEMLDDLGLVHMNGRIYDPVLGRFLSADSRIDGPLTLQGYNRYSYVRNNPIRFKDPNGKEAVETLDLGQGPGFAGYSADELNGKPLLIQPEIHLQQFFKTGDFDELWKAVEATDGWPGRLGEAWETATGEHIEGTELASAIVLGSASGIVLTTGSEDKNPTINRLNQNAPKPTKPKLNPTSSPAGERNKSTQIKDNSAQGKKTYQTYTKPAKDPSKQGDYNGRTSGTGTPQQNIANRDKKHHMNETYGPAELDKSSSNPGAIRGREQQNIDAAGGARSQGGTSGNAINGISDKNPQKKYYLDEAEKEFGIR